MGLRNTTTEWGTLAKALHWIIAIGILALIYLGLEQAGMERSDEKSRIRLIHASIATVIFSLMTLRIVWRFINETPAHPDGMSAPQKLAASLVHVQPLCTEERCRAPHDLRREVSGDRIAMMIERV